MDGMGVEITTPRQNVQGCSEYRHRRHLPVFGTTLAWKHKIVINGSSDVTF